MNILELQNVTKRYGDFVAVDSLSLEIERGKVVSILGPSGCGKTTTLRIIAGFTSPGSGAVRIAGKDIGHLRPYERNVGLLFQDYALFPHMTVAQNVAYGLRYRGKTAAEIPGRVHQMLSLVQMTPMASRYPNQLSGGQQQRVGLARALATDPQIILLDEPLSALDAKLRLELRIELKEILRSVGATTIVVTHDQEEALSLGDEIVVMQAGKIAQRGTPTQIYNEPTNRFVAEFVGRSNWFLSSVFKQAEGDLVSYDIGRGLIVRAVSEGHKSVADLCFRPENVEIVEASSGTPMPLESNVLPGRVLDVAPLGADEHVVVDVAGHHLLAVRKNQSGMSRFSPGQPVQLVFSPSNIRTF